MEQADDNFSSVAASITEVEQIAPAYRAAFENVVEGALQRIFQIEPDDASRRVFAYFHENGVPSLFAYHRGPIQIAADLSGAFEHALTGDQLARCRDFLEGEKDTFGLPERIKPDMDGGSHEWTAW